MDNYPLSQRARSLSASPTFAMLQKTTELKAQGIDIISLSVGEPDFNTPQNIKDAAKRAVDQNYSKYSPVPGYMELRKAVCKKLLRENNLQYEPQQIIVTNGGKQAVCQTIMALVDKGEEVLIPTPYWVSYPEMVKLAEGTPVFIETTIDQDFKITPQQLEQAITKQTKAIILCSPSNPTGSVYSHDELQALAEVLMRHPQVFILSDEIYEHINYVGRHESLSQFEALRDRVIILNGVSKGYAMTGWRIGWLAAPAWLAKAVNTIQGQLTSGPCSVAQKAAEWAYTDDDQSSVEQMRQAFERRRDLVCRLVADIPGLRANRPEGAFYIFPECKSYFGKTTADGRKIENADQLAMYLLEVAHVATVAGTGFGAPDYIRMSYANSEENITEGFRRIKQALDELH
ncbi:MAG: pyridoxal phosphate-dependent aminotransferase [Paludibacteraceae bacterium]|nr:pyridoxal phosphate-dependent aminotransferase [Paludibacteraceae bacterium]